MFFYSFPILLNAQHHVTVNGTSTGDGTSGSPWDIYTALSHPANVLPGDTIWLHGGVYTLTDRLESRLSGTYEKPIIVRQYPGEEAIINTSDNVDFALQIFGKYTWYWGFQVTSAASGRESDPNDNYHPHRGKAINIGKGSDVLSHPGIKCINLIVHNTAGGFGIWTSAVDGEIYGCIVFHNGYDGGAWHDPTSYRGHGHCIYTQSDTRGVRYLKDNILFWGYGMAIHAYTSSEELDNMYVEGNFIFNPGITSTISGPTEGIHIGGSPIAKDPYINKNYSYFTPAFNDGDACNLTEPNNKWWSGVENSVITNNYFVSGRNALVMYERGTATISGNTFYGNNRGFLESEFPDNNYYEHTRPTGTHVSIEPNEYEPGRAHICVINWDNLSSIDIDPDEVLNPGDGYSIYDVQNLSGEPVVSGVYEGNPVSVPLDMEDVMQAVGGEGEPMNEVTHTPIEYNVFILLSTESSSGTAIEMTEIQPISITSVEKIAVSGCPDYTNGSIVVKATGGVDSLIYTLNPNGLTNKSGQFDNLSSGEYTIVATDRYNTTKIDTTLVLNGPEPVIISNIEVLDIPNCKPGATGSITIDAKGGSGDLIYSIDPGDTNHTGVFTGLNEGYYSVRITDVNDCDPIDTSLEISAPSPIFINSLATDTITGCDGDSTGYIGVDISGGSGEYKFSLLPDGITNSSGQFPGLTAGNYIVKVVDNKECGADSSGTITIHQIDSIRIQDISIDPIAAKGYANGAINIAATGGVAPLNYTLNPGSLESGSGSFTGLRGGEYVVRVTDKNNQCAIVVSDTLVIGITGIKEYTNFNNSIHIFPNPVRDKLGIYFNDKVYKDIEIHLINALGQLERIIILNKNQEILREEIEIGFLKPGLYIIKLYNSEVLVGQRKVMIIN